MLLDESHETPKDLQIYRWYPAAAGLPPFPESDPLVMGLRNALESCDTLLISCPLILGRRCFLVLRRMVCLRGHLQALASEARLL